MSRNKQQTRRIIENAQSQEQLLETLVAYTEAAKQKTSSAAKFQELTLTQIVEIAQENGRQTGGCTLGDCILTEQHHKIVQWGEKTFLLTEKQMNVIVRENWNWLKAKK